MAMTQDIIMNSYSQKTNVVMQIRRKVSRKRSMLSGDGRKLYSEAKSFLPILGLKEQPFTGKTLEQILHNNFFLFLFIFLVDQCHQTFIRGNRRSP